MTGRLFNESSFFSGLLTPLSDFPLINRTFPYVMVLSAGFSGTCPVHTHDIENMQLLATFSNAPNAGQSACLLVSLLMSLILLYSVVCFLLAIEISVKIQGLHLCFFCLNLNLLHFDWCVTSLKLN